MKKRIKALILAASIIGLLGSSNVYAEEMQWEKVTFKMAVPSDVEISAPVYVMYTGQDTDLFAELSEDNNYTAEVNAIPGTYNIYQIVPTFPTDLSFMATSTLTITTDNPVINIYIRNAEGLLNADITDGEVPTDLASYGEMIGKQIEAEQEAEQQKIKDQQAEASNMVYEGEGILAEQPSEPTTDNTTASNERQTKINNVTATEDNTSGLAGLVVIGGCILGVGILVIIVVLLRKYKNLGEENNNERNAAKTQNQSGNYISNK